MEVSYLKFILALVFVLGLIAGCTALLRAFQEGRLGKFPRRQPRRKLELVESLILDGRYRAVVVRHEDTEHVLVLGPHAVHTLSQGEKNESR